MPADSARQGEEPGVRFCPAYLCHAELRETDTGVQVMSARAFGKPRRSGHASGPPQPDQIDIEIDLTAAREQAGQWAALAGALEDPGTLQNAWLVLSATADGHDRPPLEGARRRDLGTWEFLVGGPAAALLCAQPRLLHAPRGLAVESAEAIIHLTCHFFPADDTARLLFARDDAITRLLAAGQAAATEIAAVRDAERARHRDADGILSAESIRERVWQLGHYHLTYLLREQEDFCYD